MELQKDLHSLKSLYKLLQTTAFDIDEGACLLFKNLLDSARDNLLLASSKVIAIGSPMPSNVHMTDSVKSHQKSNGKKRCRICQQPNVHRQTNEETANDFSRHMSNSIKLIDSAILSLQRSSDLSTPVKLLSLEEPALARNEPPAFHYVHGLRIPSIQDNDGTNTRTVANDLIPLPNKSFDDLATDCASTTHCHNQKGPKPMLLDYKSSVKAPYARQQQRPTSPYRQQSEISSCSSQGFAVSSPTTSCTSTSQPETEADSTTPEKSIGHSTDYSSESYSGSSGNKHRKKSDKSIGRVRRLKNKLGFIFHHHHHHHQHHHHHHRESGTTERRSSAWKHLGMIFCHKDKERVYEKQVVEKLEKQPVSTKQAGQFQTLMKGMVRHVKQSKAVKGKMQTHHSKRHWWELFKRHQRRGVKLRVKPKKLLLKGPKLARSHL